MSTRQDITYNTVLTEIYNWIVGNCCNIDGRYDSVLASNAKNGWGYNIVNYSWSVHRADTTLYCHATLNTPLTKVTAGTVNSEISTFCTTIGLTDITRAYKIDDKNFVYFLGDLSVFLATKLAFTIPISTAQLGSPGSSTTTSGNNRQLVYMSNALPTGNLVQLVSPTNDATEYSIKMSDVVTGINNLFATVKKDIRTVQSTFSYS